jgi:hypothetical protein
MIVISNHKVESVMTKKAKKEKQKSAVLQTFGALKPNRPALTAQEERKAAEEAIAEEATNRMKT